MDPDDFPRRDGTGDPVHAKLRRAIERRERAYLWTPSDAISFVPRLLPTIFGDGRALFTIKTINQRPAYWVVRGCSTWADVFDAEEAPGVEFFEMVDTILSALEEAFGRGRCGYSGNSLFWPRKERIQFCKCEECATPRWRARWPMVDDDGGCLWARMNWPEDFATVENPIAGYGNLLALAEQEACRG